MQVKEIDCAMAKTSFIRIADLKVGDCFKYYDVPEIVYLVVNADEFIYEDDIEGKVCVVDLVEFEFRLIDENDEVVKYKVEVAVGQCK